MLVRIDLNVPLSKEDDVTALLSSLLYLHTNFSLFSPPLFYTFASRFDHDVVGATTSSSSAAATTALRR
jgi:hypothetical protein